MSRAIDANVLLYASDSRSPMNEAATAFVHQLAAGGELFYLFWPVIMAYLRISTHPSIFDQPIDPADAIANVEALLRLPNVRTAGETETFWTIWRRTIEDIPMRGNLVPDAHLAALMRENGVTIFYTRDRGFRRFDGIKVVDPFAADDATDRS